MLVTRLGLEPRTCWKSPNYLAASRFQAVSIMLFVRFTLLLCGFCAGY